MPDGQNGYRQQSPSDRPVVSVIMANHNGAAFLHDAIQSVLRQSLAALELILVDDGSADASLAIMNAAAAGDPRVQIHQTPRNLGPAGARNIALGVLRGQWAAIVDSDDLLHPRRLEWLVTAAEADGADIAADDAMLFEQHGGFAPKAMLARDEPQWVTPAEYIRNNALFRPGIALGYLKPVFRVSTTLGAGQRYNETMRIAEDYDLVARMLLAGARFRTYPFLTYFYRKHAASISHRLSAPVLQAMLAADAPLQSGTPDVAAAQAIRRQSIVDALDFTAIIAALKQRQVLASLKLAAANPRAGALLRTPVLDRLRRLAARKAVPPETSGRSLCLLTRQRVVGATNGSSAYLLNLCQTIASQGVEIHLVCPSPVMFGRWPFLALRPEMALFKTITVRGGVRIGRFIIALQPRIAWTAALTVANRLAKRAGLTRADWVQPAPYAIGAPWQPADYLYVAQFARPRAGLLLADYAFLTAGFPYALRPDSPTAVVMHDLFSNRASQFQQIGGADSVSTLTLPEEIALLSQAGTVIAIQAAEAEQIRPSLPAQRVITVPMACLPADQPAPGEGQEVLFVGSGAAPNVIGLRWFMEEVWPAILLKTPQATLIVAGGVCHAVNPAPHVSLLGQVDSLTELYRRAAVVISPLLAGSGLKIKLVEALSHGKAVVATAATLQGLGTELLQSVTLADTAESFSASVTHLLANPALRLSRGQAGLDLARSLFSAEAAHAPLIAFLQAGLPSSKPAAVTSV